MFESIVEELFGKVLLAGISYDRMIEEGDAKAQEDPRFAEAWPELRSKIEDAKAALEAGGAERASQAAKEFIAIASGGSGPIGPPHAHAG